MDFPPGQTFATPSGPGVSPPIRRPAEGAGSPTMPTPPPPDPHETLTFRDGLKLCVIELVTHFNPINTRQQKLNLLQDRQGRGTQAGRGSESGGLGCVTWWGSIKIV